MEIKLDAQYDRQRRALVDKISDAVEKAWKERDKSDIDPFLSVGNRLLDTAATAYVKLLNSYYRTRCEIVTGEKTDHEIDPNLFLVETIRPDEVEFLRQGLGVLIHELGKGKDFVTADHAASAYIRTAVRTHLQAIQVRAAALWMATS